MNRLPCLCCVDNLPPQYYPDLAAKIVDGLAIGQDLPPSDPVGTPMVERCAREAEADCKASGCDEACAHRIIAARIRAAAPRLEAEREQEIRANVFEHVLNGILASICSKHADFAPVLASEGYRRMGRTGMRPQPQWPSSVVKS